MLRIGRAGLLRTGLLLAFIVALELICRTRIVSPTTLISPSEMLIALIGVLRSGQYNGQIGATVVHVGTATVATIIAGTAFGVVLHGLPRLRRAVQPFLASCYAVPGFIFYIPLLGIFGVGGMPLILIGFILAVPSMVLATLGGLDRIPHVYLRASRSWRMGRLATIFLVQIPCAAPYLFSGMRLCVAYAFIGVLASEFILSDRGIGYSIAFAYHDFDVQTMYAMMLLIILLVTVVNSGLQAWERHLMARRRR